MTADIDMADPCAVAFYSDIDVTLVLADKWAEWKSNYVNSCVERWIGQGTTRDEALEGAAVVMAELCSIDDVPWMPMGKSLGIKLEAMLMAGEMPWQGEKRTEFMLACRTLDLCDGEVQELAAAYQMGVSVEQLKAKAPRSERTTPNQRCAVYRHYDRKGVLLYVGIADNPTLRAAQHKADSPWHQFSNRMSVEWFENRAEADQAERAAIKFERPAFNINHNVANRKAAVDYLFAALGGES